MTLGCGSVPLAALGCVRTWRSSTQAYRSRGAGRHGRRTSGPTKVIWWEMSPSLRSGAFGPGGPQPGLINSGVLAGMGGGPLVYPKLLGGR